ncbi:hypothetical protein BT69DRAFT_1331924 [Atractiella rhizophila]|nr:hypothetical protein BT69DRAFT_1340209 [Atractiella rhizophila]KAH8925680.1 hypothetical protein BT69DRAFT_1331924 [Atractiella rhizophila]
MKIEVYVTSILSNTKIRAQHEMVQRSLSRIPNVEYLDVASDESIKLMWKKRNENSNELPCVCVDGKRVGSCQELEEAVEFGELDQFLKAKAGSGDADLEGITEAEAAALEAEMEKQAQQSAKKAA